jgi:hypothetical protein
MKKTVQVILLSTSVAYGRGVPTWNSIEKMGDFFGVSPWVVLLVILAIVGIYFYVKNEM